MARYPKWLWQVEPTMLGSGLRMRAQTVLNTMPLTVDYRLVQRAIKLAIQYSIGKTTNLTLAYYGIQPNVSRWAQMVMAGPCIR